MQMEHIEPVVEIFAELLTPHRRFERFVGRRNDADIYRDGLAAPEAADFLFLQGAQQLGLDGQGEFPELVQKQRPATRILKAPGLAVGCPCEGALFVAEELTF